MKNSNNVIAREKRQLEKLTRVQSKGAWVGYFGMLLFLVGFVNIIDEVTSNLSVSVQSSFVTEFFVILLALFFL